MRRPVVQVIGQSGADLVPGWIETLTRVSLLDNDGGEADELEIEFSVSAPFPPSPAEGTRYHLFYGWAGEPIRDGGIYTYQSDSLAGDAEGGWLMTIVARSADFVDADKAADSEHFEEMEVGDIFRQLALRAGKKAEVDPDLARLKLPYRLRLNQSAVSFGQDLADEIGGTLKFAGGKWLVPQRNGGKSATGRQLPTIMIPFSRVISGSVSSEGRGKYKDVEASYFDPAEGVQKLFKAVGLGDASRFLGLHPARSSSEAEYAGKAEAAQLGRGTISGSLTLEGDTEPMAGAPVQLFGFGPSRDGLDLIASSIQHEFSFEEGGGWLMTVEVANRKGSGDE